MKSSWCAATAAALLMSPGCSPSSSGPLAMRVVVLSIRDIPDGGKWNELIGRPLIEVEYAASVGVGTSSRNLFLYDGRTPPRPGMESPPKSTPGKDPRRAGPQEYGPVA